MGKGALLEPMLSDHKLPSPLGEGSGVRSFPDYSFRGNGKLSDFNSLNKFLSSSPHGANIWEKAGRGICSSSFFNNKYPGSQSCNHYSPGEQCAPVESYSQLSILSLIRYY